MNKLLAIGLTLVLSTCAVAPVVAQDDCIVPETFSSEPYNWAHINSINLAEQGTLEVYDPIPISNDPDKPINVGVFKDGCFEKIQIILPFKKYEEYLTFLIPAEQSNKTLDNLNKSPSN